MKSKLMQSIVLVAGFNALMVVSSTPVFAQLDPPTQKHVTQQTRSVTAFKIEHVHAERMALWLTPPPTSMARQDAEKKGGILSEIPGLESVVAHPKANEVWVTGTPESIAKLRQSISIFDHPARTVEVKVQFVEVDESAVADFGVYRAAGTSTRIFEAQSVFRDKLQELIRSKRAKVFHASQVTTANNTQAKAGSIANGLAPEIEWTATPFIEFDDTITVLFTPQINSKLKMFVTTSAILKAGESMVFEINIANNESREILAIVSAQITEG